MSTRKTDWRTRSRREIKDTGVAARKSLIAAEKYGLKIDKDERDTNGLPVSKRVSLAEELEYLSAALSHVQRAEDQISMLRTLLTKRRERLETEHEKEIAFGPETYAVLAEAETKPKRLKPELLGQVIPAEWQMATERGETETTWGRATVRKKIARGLSVSESTVSKYVREMERSTT